MKMLLKAAGIALLQFFGGILSLLLYFPKGPNYLLVCIWFPGGLIAFDHDFTVWLQKSTKDVGIYFFIFGANLLFWSLVLLLRRWARRSYPSG